MPLLFFSVNAIGQSTAIYNITFTSSWNATDHTSIPDNAHWSDLVGATHKTPNTFLELGQLASVGIKDVAELGSNTSFEAEVNNGIDSNEANQWLQKAFSPHAAISSASLTNVEVHEDFPLLTLVSMVAPSPDWFISINSLNLRNEDNTNWKPSFSIDVFAYDAGTDDGTDYKSTDMVSSPPVEIFKITGTPFNGNAIGTLSVTLQSVLSTNSNGFENITVYPNPSNGEITISKPNNISLKTIEVYSIIGKLVKVVKPKKTIDFSELNKGVYVLKLLTENGQGKTLKLLLK